MWRPVDTRTLVVTAIGLLGGSCWLFEQPVLPPRLFPIACLGVCALILPVLRHFRTHRISPIVAPIALAAAAFVTGFTIALVASEQRLSDRLVPALHGSDILVSGTIDGLVTKGAAYTGFVLSDVAAVSSAHTVPRRIKLAWYANSPELTPGEQWQLVVRLREIHGTQNPGGFDLERWALSRNIGAKGYVRSPHKAIRVAPASWHDVDAARASIAARIDNAVQQTSVAGVLRALSVGDRSGLGQPQWQLFRETGTSHLIAISGLHIGFVAMLTGGLVMLLLKLWCLPCRFVPARITGVFFGVLAATGYAALAGFSVSTQRALIMVVIVAIALLTKTRSRLVRALALALIVVLVIDPLTPLSTGLWLSFGAVALIAIISGASLDIGRGREQSPSLKMRAISSVTVWSKLQFVLSVAMLPAGLMLFGQASLCSIFANALAIPWTTFLIVPPLLTSLLLEPVSAPLSKLLLWVASISVELMIGFLERVASLPFATVSGSAPDLLALALFVTAVIVITLARLAPLSWLTLIWCAPVVFPPSGVVSNSLKVTALDVGQGLAVVVQAGPRSLVFDTGASFGAGDAGERIVVPYLKSMGIRNLDVLIVSHGDNDHAGGLASVRREYESARILVGDEAIADNAQLCRAGESWQWGQARFRILAPLASSGRSENDRSCVLQVSSPWGGVLLTGDIEARGEFALREAYGDRLRSDVLIVPHHGARTSSTLPFLRDVGPSVALISAGYRNRFGHPHPGVLDRYRDAGIQTVNTAEAGAIEVSLSATGLSVRQFRQTHRRFWHRSG